MTPTPPALQTTAPEPPPSQPTVAGLTALIEELPAAPARPAVRAVIDYLDRLQEQVPIRVSSRLFAALADPSRLRALVDLTCDLSAPCAQTAHDVRRVFRYPYWAAHILANGSQVLRDAFLGDAACVTSLLDFLDPRDQRSQQQHPIVVSHVVSVLATYLEWTPDVLLRVFAERPGFVPAVVSRLHSPDVARLLSVFIPSRCVDAVGAADPTAAFDDSMTTAMAIFAKARVFHCLAAEFAAASETVCDVTGACSNKDELASGAELEVFHAEQRACNVAEVYATLVAQTVRAVRVDSQSPACVYLNVFANPTTAATLGEILLVGVDTFKDTNGTNVNILFIAVDLAIRILEAVEHDREKRLASVFGQPPPVDMQAIEPQLVEYLRELMKVLLQTAGGLPMFGRVRLRILELFVACQHACPETMAPVLDSLRFGEVAFTFMLRNKRNSTLHRVISNAVQVALLSDRATAASRRHWLVRSRLVVKILRAWESENASVRWFSPEDAQTVPFLSAIVHMACCVQHWIAHTRANARPGEPDLVTELIGKEKTLEFEEFCNGPLARVLEDETRILGGVRPPRRSLQGARIGGSTGIAGDPSGAMLRRTNSGFAGAGSAVIRSGVHLTRSPSAHRFGYVEPRTPSRARLEDLFSNEDDGDDFGISFLDRSSLGDAFGSRYISPLD